MVVGLRLWWFGYVFWVVAMGFGGVGLGLSAWVWVYQRGLWWVWVCQRGYGGFGWLPWDSVVGLGGPAWVRVCWRGYGGFGWLPWDSVAWVWVCQHGLWWRLEIGVKETEREVSKKKKFI